MAPPEVLPPLRSRATSWSKLLNTQYTPGTTDRTTWSVGKSGSEELRHPERRVLAGQVAGAADVGAAALQVLAAGVAVGLRVPDLLNRRGVQIAEDGAAVEVGAAERYAPVPKDG